MALLCIKILNNYFHYDMLRGSVRNCRSLQTVKKMFRLNVSLYNLFQWKVIGCFLYDILVR